MPWTTEDVEGKTKAADTPKKKRQWVAAANSRLAACLADGGKRDFCEASAIKVANAAVKEGAVGEWIDSLDDGHSALLEVCIHGLKSALGSERELRRNAEQLLREPRGEGLGVGGERQRDFGADVCICPKCKAEAKHEKGTPCTEVKCPKCGAAMVGKEREAGQVELGSDFIALQEKSVRKDGTIPIKIIRPGWATSGYYSSEVLERDGPKVLTKGTKMFWDHPTEAEETERPEGSLKNLAGELATDAYWESGNVMGPGLYADAKVFSEFRGAVDELAPHIGLSIRGYGKAKNGEAEGKKGPLVEEMAIIQSVDFVTLPGAGGQVMQLFESARTGRWTNISGGKKMEELEKLKEAYKELEGKLAEAEKATTDAEKAKDEAETKVAKLGDALMLRKTSDFVSGKLAKIELPEIVKTRLIESLSADPLLTDEGKLDEKATATKVEETVKSETEFLAEVIGSGTIRGMGGSGDAGAGKEGHDALVESFQSKFEDEGIPAEQAERMAKIAAGGR